MYLYLNIIEKILNYNMDDILYCNIFLALRILLTMPITSANIAVFVFKI